MAFRSQAKVAQTNSLMCSYSSRRRTISFRFMARATSSMRRSPFHVLTRDHDLSHRSAFAMSLLSTGRTHGLYVCLWNMWGSLFLVWRPCTKVYMDVVSQYDLNENFQVIYWLLFPIDTIHRNPFWYIKS